jgi:hypothetical protein
MPLINFRCWKCRRKYAKSSEKIGTQFTCSCDYVLRVPKTDGGNSRVKTVADYVVEAALCGGGGALLGFCLAVFILSRSWLVGRWWSLVFVAGSTIGCGLIGFFGGEHAIDYIGDMIRQEEQD